MAVSVNLDLVTYSILLGSGPGTTPDVQIPAQIQILDISVYQELNKIPYACISIVDGSAADATFELSDSQLFRLGKSISIKLGYNGGESIVFTGIIINSSHKLDGRSTTLNLICKHEVVKMTVGRRNRHFNDLSDNEIVENIFQEYGITNLEIEDFGVNHEQLIQSNVSDWDFALSRSDMYGMVCSIREAVRIFKPDPSADPVLNLIYGENLLSFSTESDLRSQASSVTAFGWDHANQSVLEQEGQILANASPGNVEAETYADIFDQAFRIKSPSITDSQSLQAIAEAKRHRQALSKVQGRVKFMGNSGLRPGDWVNIQGIGNQFSGKVFISSVEHEFNSGNWTTSASIGWEEDFFAEKFNPFSPLSATGQFAGIDGLHIGKVTDIVDPLGQGRIRIRLPLINTDDAGVWARLATLDAGSNRGSFFMPDIDDEVIIGFLGGDPSYPIVLGMMHSSAKPPPFEAADANEVKGYVSRSEVKIVIHDGDKSITIETPGGRIVKMNDDTNEIEITDAVGNTIKMDDSGINIESSKEIKITAGSSLSLSAPQIAIAADASVSMEASGSLSLEGGGETKIGGGMVDIQGGLVKIN